MEHINQIRKEFIKQGFDAYYITGSDAHQSEYTTSRYRTREYATGFTGSAGQVLITKDNSYLWVDGRYFIQAAAQIEGTEIQLMKMLPDTKTILQVMQELPKGSKVAVDSQTIAYSTFNEYNKALGTTKLCSDNFLLDKVWLERPDFPSEPIVELYEEVTGETRSSKLEKIRVEMRKNKAKMHLISSLDDIAWILNIRSKDVLYTPVAYGHLIITLDTAYFFTKKSKCDKALIKSLKSDNVEVKPYDKVLSFIKKERKGKLLVNTKRVGAYFIEDISSRSIVDLREPSTDLKAQKNDVELEGFRLAHIIDGVAMVKLLYKLDSMEDKTEISIADELEKLRRDNPLCLDLSFNTIAGFKENGALPHYSATPESFSKVEGNGLMVLDSGGQYSTGTTDITRTLLFGEATEEEIHDYTLVIKGHIALASQRFFENTKGIQLDILARMHMWNEAINYNHGTGHGVGHRLSVHEGPMGIRNGYLGVNLKEGMVLSDEPGIYKANKHGIRIENLIAVQKDGKNEFGTWYSFETLTACPYERKLIDKKMLNEKEIVLIDAYHKWVESVLSPYLEDDEKKMLIEMTKPL